MMNRMHKSAMDIVDGLIKCADVLPLVDFLAGEQPKRRRRSSSTRRKKRRSKKDRHELIFL